MHPRSVLSSDEESSNTSTPTTSTPFSLASPHDHFQAANILSNSGTVTPSSSPQTLLLEDSIQTSPFITDLINQGVRYINYNALRTIKELGSVST